MPEVLANKIAAGEVVQRPSSVVKELVENSLDSGATRIDVVVKSAGSELIQVTDNGCGMGSDDAIACFERHATSKITEITDLERIRTLGFRGEALASIAAVSRTVLKTGSGDGEPGTLVQIDGGSLIKTEPTAIEQGTSISVKSLFFNVPARRNFLKTDATEYRHIVDTFLMLAVSNPAVGFSLSHNGASIFKLDAYTDDDFDNALKQRLANIYDTSYTNDLIWIDESTGYLSVSGCIAVPERHKRSRGDQYLFVNGRSIRSRYLEHAIRGAYEDYLPEGAYPMFALFLRMDPAHVDVNVHPTKAEVKFDDERGVYAMIRAIAGRALASAFSIPEFRSEDSTLNSSSGVDLSGPRFTGHKPFGIRTGPFDRSALSEHLYREIQTGDTDEPGLLANAATLSRDEAGRDLVHQLALRYIVVHMRSGLMLVDQNRAHERVIFERALSNLNGTVAMSQQLLFPVTIDLDPREFERVSSIFSELKLLGFDIQKFGGTSVMVRGVPVEVREGEIEGILHDAAHDRPGVSSSATTYREQLARSLARRTSVKTGVRMTDSEMRSLIDQLFVCESPYVSPDGKPVVVWVSTDEIDRRFEQMARPS
ncbi:MAG: DNA mismatch repair endonuclease MutL [Rhodothermales bacterium]|nr:DNA mismatch repair endonuclease MutL [Rhodothermales bacterium]